MSLALAWLIQHWRLLIAAGLAGLILFQHFEIVAKNAEIAQIRERQVEAVNEQLTQNSQTEAKWHNAITAGFQNYQAVNETTRAKYERQINQLRQSSAGGMQPGANESGAVSGDTAAADFKACADRLSAARAAASGCVDVARAASECQATVNLLLDSWPK